MSLGIVVMCLLTVRVAWMQTAHTSHYAMLSEDNYLRRVPVAPPRGLIFDRHGALLADNTVQYSLSLLPEQIDSLEQTVQRLQPLLEIRSREVQQFQRRSRGHKFEKAALRLGLNEDEIARVAVQLHGLPGVYLEPYPSRRYVYRNDLAHVLGYLGYISEQARKRIDRSRYRGTQRIGRGGIESQYESLLLGLPGLQQLEVNAQGRMLQQFDRTAPTPGANLVLTLDAKLQQAAALAMREHQGAVVAIEPATGDILALVSAPDFDPNMFAHSLDPQTYRSLETHAKRPLLNRAIQGQYPPGSAIKPFMALAGLEYGVARPGESFFAGPNFRLPNRRRPFRDWKKQGHGWVTLSSAITQSCDVYFYSMANQLGIDAIHDFLAQFGFGQTLQLDLAGERPGLLPSRQWKQKNRGEPWYPGETVITGIGQGYFLITPLQLASAAATLATRGQRMKPRLLLEYEQGGQPVTTAPEIAGHVQVADPSWWDLVHQAMINVAHAPNGTAWRIGRSATYTIAGKTATAQVIDYKDEHPDSADMEESVRDHSMFIAFAPAENPRIALAVVVEHGGHGSTTAAPIARKLLDAYLLKPESDST